MSPLPFLHYSLFFISLILAKCLAETLASKRELNGASAGLNQVETLPFSRSLGSTASADESKDVLELLDIVLVASVDGKFHALDRGTGETLWSMPTTLTADAAGASASAPTSLQPLITTRHADYDPDLDEDSSTQETYIIEPQSGDIYVASSPSGPLQRLPFSMPQLVDMSPFSFEDTDRRVFVGKKKTSLLLIDLETGKVKAALDSECPWDPFEDLADKDPMDIDLDELDGTKPHRAQHPTEIFIGRTDYHISIHTRPNPPSSRKIPVQHLSFSTYGPNNQDLEQQAVYSRTSDDTYIDSLPNGEIISFKRRKSDGSLSANTFVWAQKFSNPVVAIFDVVKSRKRREPFVLLQPRPRLQDVLPAIDLPAAVKSRRFPNLDAAYVGLVEETGSLFALSPDHFPLVVFGGPYNRRLKAIDPPPGIMDTHAVDPVSDLHELCETGSTDLRCLVGIRPLEANSRSRLARLLDGAPTIVQPPSSNTNSQMLISDDTKEDPILPHGDDRTIIPPRPWIDSGQTIPLLGGLPSVQSYTAAVLTFIVFGVIAFWSARSVRNRRNERPSKTASAVIDVDVDTVKGTPAEKVSVATDISDFFPVTVHERPSTPPQYPALLSTVKGLKTPLAENTLFPDPIDDLGDDDSEKEGDAAATPNRRKNARRRRGKKKRGNAKDLAAEDVDADENENEKPEDVTGNISQLLISNIPKPIAAPSLVVSDTVLGFGSHGTVVYRGSMQGRAVAVKRLLHDFVTLASREVSLLQDADDHPNVIRYYYQEAQANFLYIALELCPASLADIIERPDQFREIAIAFEPKRALRQITSGLRHLHALKIVHRDIKPQNILVSSAKKGIGESAGHRMLISDFGLCRKLEMDQTSFLPTAGGVLGVGTVGWRAPEILRGEVKLDETTGEDSQSSRDSIGTTASTSTAGKSNPTRLTKSVDIFALGCLFYYTLTNGGHPFGDRFEREVNILRNERSLAGLEQFGEEGSEAVDLISAMLEPEASARPDTTTCLMHPYFWDPGRRLAFLQDASDRFEIMCRDPRDPDLVRLEENASSVVGPDWPSRLDKIFVENLGKFRKYDGRSVQDLLRALRNKKHHYQDLPDNVKRHVGSMPEGYLSYFTRRFPRLFLHVHSVIANSSLRLESMFRSYFDLAD